MSPESFAAAVAGRLIVSCQAGRGIRCATPPPSCGWRAPPSAVGRPRSAAGGVGGVPDVAAVAAAVDVPVIGLTKDGTGGVFITPTVEAARAVPAAYAQMVAADATFRPRPDGRPLTASIEAVHDAGALFMADVSTLDEGIAAAEAGADAIATTAATRPRSAPDGPDVELVRALRQALPDALIVAEGATTHRRRRRPRSRRARRASWSAPRSPTPVDHVPVRGRRGVLTGGEQPAQVGGGLPGGFLRGRGHAAQPEEAVVERGPLAMDHGDARGAQSRRIGVALVPQRVEPRGVDGRRATPRDRARAAATPARRPRARCRDRRTTACPPASARSRPPAPAATGNARSRRNPRTRP